METYTGAKTAVFDDGQKSGEFGTSVAVHQGANLSPSFFSVMLYVTESARHNDLMELLYADDLVVREETVAKVITERNKWKAVREMKGLEISLKKTKAIASHTGSILATVMALDPCGVCRKRVGVNLIR